MKKTSSMLVIIAVCLSMLFVCSSCGAKHPIEKFKDQMVKANNYQLTITMTDVPLLGTFTTTTKIDGNIQYTPAVLFSSEQYTEISGNVKNVYTKGDDGKWTKEVETVEEESDDMFDDQFVLQIFNPDNYEEVKGEKNTYKQKAGVTFDGYEDVTLIITDESCTIQMKANSDGLVFGVTIVISEIGKIDLTLPQVE